MAGWHHRLNGHEFEQTPGDGEGQGSLACCSILGCKESDTTEQLNNHLLIQNESPEYHFFPGYAGSLLRCGAQQLQHAGFCCCGLVALGHVGS